MGHLHSTDLEALESAATTVWELAREYVFTGAVEYLKMFPELTLTGPSFRIEFRLQQDVIDPAGDGARSMVMLRFAQLRRDVEDPGWTLSVRGHWPDRTDHFPRVGPWRGRQLRKAFSPKRQPAGSPDRFALTNDDIYVMDTTPPEDLTAQLCLFALQTELSIDGTVMPWLLTYLTNTFAISNHAARKEVATEVMLRLIRNNWWMEDARAWRAYVAKLLRAAGRDDSVQADELDDDLSDGTTERRVIEAIEGDHEGTDRPGPIGLPSKAPMALDLTKDTFSVQEASQYLGVSVGTVYSRIHKHQLRVQPAPGAFVIHKTDLDRAMAEPRLPDVIDAVAAARTRRVETARRHVSRLRRRGLTLDQILHDPEI
jgi:excisionase family DNA binding protein